jgi:hypothetical protein
MHDEWPMTAIIQKRDDTGEWRHYSQISTYEDAVKWIAKRPDPENWRAYSLPVE